MIKTEMNNIGYDFTQIQAFLSEDNFKDDLPAIQNMMLV